MRTFEYLERINWVYTNSYGNNRLSFRRLFSGGFIDENRGITKLYFICTKIQLSSSIELISNG